MNRIVILFIFILKIIKLSDLALKTIKANENEVVRSDDRANKIVINLSKNNKSRNLICIPNIKAIKKLTFLNPNAKKIFNYLKQTFIKGPILQHFDLKSHI